MGEPISLASAADGFRFDARRFAPRDARRGGVVVIQEIFGVTRHIEGQALAFAEVGYEALAPSLFDRRERGFAAGHDQAGIAKGRALSEAAPWDEVAGDLQAAVAALAPPVFVVGYCWGGTAAWLAACRVPGVAAASAYYGRRIPELMGETPACPIILHFGARDATIPPATIEAIAGAHPDIPIHLYEAGHGFASDRRGDFSPDAARLAQLRTLQLFARHGAGQTEI